MSIAEVENKVGAGSSCNKDLSRTLKSAQIKHSTEVIFYYGSFGLTKWSFSNGRNFKTKQPMRRSMQRPGPKWKWPLSPLFIQKYPLLGCSRCAQLAHSGQNIPPAPFSNIQKTAIGPKWAKNTLHFVQLFHSRAQKMHQTVARTNIKNFKAHLCCS